MQHRDPMVHRPVTKPIHRWVTGMHRHDFEVVKLQYDAKQFADIVQSALPVLGRPEPTDEYRLKNQDLMYFTIPVCVVKYAHILRDSHMPVASPTVAGLSNMIIDLMGDSDEELEMDSDIELAG